MKAKALSKSMIRDCGAGWRGFLAAGLLVTLVGVWPVELARAQSTNSAQFEGEIVQISGGEVLVRRGNNQPWTIATVNPPKNRLFPGDQVRTGPKSRVTIRWRDGSPAVMGPNGLLTLPSRTKRPAIIRFLRGAFYFFHWGRPSQYNLETPAVSAVVRGTEFGLDVRPDGATRLTVLDGVVLMTNAMGGVILHDLEQGYAAPGKAPVRKAFVQATNEIQWILYYPALLDLADLISPKHGGGVPAQTKLRMLLSAETPLTNAFRAYQKGNLFKAADELEHIQLPKTVQAPSRDVKAAAVGPIGTLGSKVFEAAMSLAFGKVTETEALLDDVQRQAKEGSHYWRLAEAIRKVIAATKHLRYTNRYAPELPTEWLAEAYYEQSRWRLAQARLAVLHAIEVDPDFAYAWARLAEIEFSFGRIHEAREAVERAIELAPDHAQAIALKGFLLAAENRIEEATECFQCAISKDSRLGNAWLGLGLCRMRKGQVAQGINDLELAVTTEPDRALLRSYLAKAWNVAGNNEKALDLLDHAIELDPNDPIPWAYNALIKQEENRINESIADLETAQRLVIKARVERSRALRELDRAVGSANLARIYEDAGMSDWSVREAVRAVNADYTSFGGHLFLANSYATRRDVRTADLRFESPALSEYLVANLLSPVGAGVLSPTISQREYSKLLESEGLGLISLTSYESFGDWSQLGAQYGTFGNISYSLEGSYLSRNGQRINDQLEQKSLSGIWKQQVTGDDTVYFQINYAQTDEGDLAQSTTIPLGPIPRSK